MTDDLDQLTDAALSEVFAVEVAGEKPERLAFASKDGGESGCLFEASRFSSDQYGVSRWVIEDHCKRYPEYKVIVRDVFHTPYATSADAVLPYVDKYTAETDERDGGEPMVFRIYSPAGPEDVWAVEPYWMHHDGTIPWGEPSTAKTLARVLCIALIKAKRAEKGAS